MLENRITEIIAPTVKDLGFDIVTIKIHGAKMLTIEILIDRLDGANVTIENCRTVSRSISALLDVEDVVSEKYFLHVSSAGIERPLVKLSDYQRYIGREVRIRLKHIVNGRIQLKGKITNTELEDITIEKGEEKFVVAFSNIKNANLILTDELFRELLKKDFKE